ncbi:MAG: glycoside hydrolase family 127 protein [Kiritimatiellae bacterium]|nr:glycoside hydrolase family 127 protein [Kiritimatiellia bacterium]
MNKLLFGMAAMSAGLCMAGDYPFRPAEMTNVTVKAGFWLPRFETNRIVTVQVDFRKSEDTGRIANFELAGERAGRGFQGIPFNDSDVFKIIEGAAYTLSTHPDPKLEKYLDNLIAKIAKAQEPDGYLYTARTLHFNYGFDEKTGKAQYRMMGPTRWSNTAHGHELYNVGHMYEAAAAYYWVTGKRTLLDVAIKNADLVCRTFGPEPTQLKNVPGHEEIELALCKLYRATGDEKYLRQAKHFLDQRGKAEAADRRPNGKVFAQSGALVNSREMGAPGSYNQNHRLVTEQQEAVGHAVRATYLYCGMADVAALTGDRSYVKAIDTIWENVVSKKLHLNGSVGARHAGEAFGENYELPNASAYLETCAGIGNALWNQRMFLMYGDAKYIDVLERVVYNGFLSGISLGGDEFFYPNPQASRGGYKRSKWFGCSCCPVNVVRFIPQIAQFAYATRGDAAYVNLFVASDAKLNLTAGDVTLKHSTEYPWKGFSRIEIADIANAQRTTCNFKLNIRVPGWCVGRPVPSDLYTQTMPGSLADFTVKVNGESFAFTPEKGYCAINRAWKKGDVVEVTMNMPVRRIKAHDAVKNDCGRLAVEVGPILYCAEGVDNDGKVLDKVLAADAAFTPTTCNILGNVYPALTAPAVSLRRGLKSGVRKEATTLTLVPYFAWCHRDAGEMQVFFPTEVKDENAAFDFKTSASFCYPKDSVAAAFDGILPKASNDESIPRLTFWNHLGTDEWVACEFAAPEEVKGVEVYWFDDGKKGNCRIPASWKVQWRPAKNAPWLDIAAAGPVAKDEFCTITFRPVKAQAVRLAIKLQQGWSGGILEWTFL